MSMFKPSINCWKQAQKGDCAKPGAGETRISLVSIAIFGAVRELRLVFETQFHE